MKAKPTAPAIPDRASASRRFAIEAANLAANTRCQQVVILDLRALSPVTDYYVIASGTSPRQMRTVCEEVAELGQSQDQPIFRASGLEGETWMVMDFVDIVLHVFNQTSRSYYDLDNLWGDAPHVEWNTQPNQNPQE